LKAFSLFQTFNFQLSTFNSQSSQFIDVQRFVPAVLVGKIINEYDFGLFFRRDVDDEPVGEQPAHVQAPARIVERARARPLALDLV
jgi:hypothetical protein